MARTSKNTSKKTEVKEVKPEVKTEIVEEKKIDEPKMGATDIIQNECDVNIDDMDDNLTENGIQKDENNDEVTKSVNPSDEVTNDGDKTSIEEDNKTAGQHNSAPRWAKDVYGYNWMGQCYDE